MIKFLRHTRHRVITGVELHTSGSSTNIFIPISRVRHHQHAPVVYNGKAATLYFANYYKKIGLNDMATRLFDREGFSIYGPAIVSTNVETWNCFRVLGTKEAVMSKISELTLGDYAVVPTSRRNTHQDVIAKRDADIVVLRLALSL